MPIFILNKTFYFLREKEVDNMSPMETQNMATTCGWKIVGVFFS
jgi:hypothetical protein